MSAFPEDFAITQLDRHILIVRNKMTLVLFLQAWAWTALFLAAIVWLAIIAERVTDRALPHWSAVFWLGAAASAAAALAYSIVRRPNSSASAMVIDQGLNLREKYSTALYARSLDDPFARAAVIEAEYAAKNVRVNHLAPLRFPPLVIAVALLFLGALLTSLWLPPLHLFGRSAPPAQAKASAPSDAIIQKKIKQQLPTIERADPLLNNNPDVKRAEDELAKALQTKEGDQFRSRLSTLSALQDFNKAITEELDKNEKFQTAMDQQAALADMKPAADDSTPLGKAQNQLKAGNIDAAMKNISKAVGEFQQMSQQDQAKAVQQAQQLANELAKAANDPRTGEKIAHQLMQMGATQAQAQQMAATMQQAAQGNQQAQQKLQQMAQQMAQAMNNGQGPTAQQQQMIQSMMIKAQSLANSQNQAMALSQNAQALAQAMAQSQLAQQMARQMSPQMAGAQRSSAQQQMRSGGQHPGQMASASGKMPGQPQQGPNGNQGQSQGQQSQSSQGASSQQGQSAGGQGQQSMAQAQQALQQQLQQMQAQAKDAQQMKVAADAAAQAAADAASGAGEQEGGDSQADNSSSQGQDPSQCPPGPGQVQGWNSKPGKGGARMPIAQAPYTLKQEMDPSKNIDSGKTLASRYVHAGIDPGVSRLPSQAAAPSADQDAEDDVDQEQVPRQAQQAEKDYFTAIQQSGQ